MLYDDEDEYELGDSLQADLVERVAEAQRSIAWAAKAYEELYGVQPSKESWCAAIQTMVESVNVIKGTMADDAPM